MELQEFVNIMYHVKSMHFFSLISMSKLMLIQWSQLKGWPESEEEQEFVLLIHIA